MLGARDLHAQTRALTGTVKGSDGAAISGATVPVKGTSLGTSTNVDGRFDIQAPASATTLVVSYVGYESKQVAIGDQSTVNVTLATAQAGLDEVVVVGYGTQLRRDLTGSVATIKGNAIAATPVQSFNQGLQGRASGVSITTPNGVLNNPPVIRIRGANSIALSSGPLVVVDGIPTYSGNSSAVGRVYDQIIIDLNYAEQNLPLTYTASQSGVSTSTLNATRAHRNTAIALKTRVYLSMGRYDDVTREANKIVSSTAPFVASSGVNHALASTVAAVFAAPQETSESILSFPFTAQDTPGTQNQLAYYYLPTSLGGNGEYGLNNSATGILNNAGWLSTDNRRTNFVAPVTTTNTAGVRTTEYFLTKYPTGTPYTDKAPVIRYAEVLLNLSEARVRSTNTVDAQALALLNAVRGRSNPAIAATATTPAVPIAAFVALDFTSATTFLNALLLERRIEFLGEGIRNVDLMRLDATIPGKGSVGAVDPTNVLYVWPIPSTELAANLLMTRN